MSSHDYTNQSVRVRGSGFTGQSPCIPKPRGIVLQIMRMIFCQEIYINEHPVLAIAVREDVLAFHVTGSKRQELFRRKGGDI